MRTVTPQHLADLQRKPANIRNICILAHVDHGKTTLADALISSNGIISSRLAGKLRYMDSREDEQLRGITMKSSAISLHCNQGGDEFLVNLIDSPGHVDFSSEVSTAVRLCDGALVVIDVVEGVCPQTHVVLRQAWLEGIKPCLVLNKIDRLITELKYTPMEAHVHLQQVLEQVNAVVGNLFASDVFEKASQKSENKPPPSPSKENLSREDQVYDWSDGLEETDDSQIYFSPDEGNVIFASAIDGWGFRINQFAEFYASKLGIKADVLRKTLWGDFYLNTKTKRIMKGAQAKAKKPLFVQFVLDNIWNLYETVLERRDKEKMEKIIKSLGLKVGTRDLRSNDPKVPLQAIYSQWIPVSKAALGMVCEKLPSPLDISEERIEKLMCSGGRRFDSLPEQTQRLKAAFQQCSSEEDAPVIVYVSKMFSVDKKALPQNRQRALTKEELEMRREQARQRHAARKAAAELDAVKETGDENETKSKKDTEEAPKVVTFSNEDEIFTLPEENTTKKEQDDTFLAFARVFSGNIGKGKKLLVLGPKHDPHNALEGGEKIESVTEQTDMSSPHINEYIVGDLFLLMGRELESLESVPAGNVLGIGGLEDLILKSATLSSTVACPVFTDMPFAAPPIVRVAIEPKHLSEMPLLLRGLKLLNQADPCVQVLLQETGEHVIVAAGEVHLERCLDDLRKRFAKIEIDVSAPIIPFRETIIIPPKIDMVNEIIDDINQIQKKNKAWEEFESEGIIISKDRQVEIQTSNNKCTFRLRALPLPPSVTNLLEEHGELIRILDQFSAATFGGRPGEQIGLITLTETTITQLLELKQKLQSAFEEAGKKWRNAIEQIWSFGPKRNGPNILFNRIDDYDRVNIWQCLDKDVDKLKVGCIREYDNSIVSGFQLATLAGPICEEPMMGVGFALEHWQLEGAEHNAVKIRNNPFVNVSESVERTNGGLDIKNSKSEKPTSNGDFNSTDSISTPVGSPITPVGSPTTPIGSPVSSPVGSLIPRVYGPLSGQIISTIKEGFRIAFQVQPRRLMAAMYKCDIQCTAEVLGRMYAVMSKRNGQVLQDDMREGSPIFDIVAALPVAESFGFCEEIRKRTSGLASPQLFYSHWEVIPSDPYWVPSTEEELLHFGEKADYESQARKYMNNVRRRKGLYVDEKIVEHAEKQRTLSKNK